MADYQLIIIGGGLSGLAAGIRSARFGRRTLILEQHSLAGGLNSYYFRHGHLLETGLHAMTNYAAAADRRAPLNRLFRQLKLSRKRFVTRQQFGSEIIFPKSRLSFTNDPSVLAAEVAREFPRARHSFSRLLRKMEEFDPFTPAPRRSARTFLHDELADPLLENMLLLPLMVYGNAEEYDMDLAQFAIMFRALFLEGFFRPEQTIREFLTLLVDHYKEFAGELRLNTQVKKITRNSDRVTGVCLNSGEVLQADAVLSTVGLPLTAKLSGWPLDVKQYTGRMSFMETISLIPAERSRQLSGGRTILFYTTDENWHYMRPDALIDPFWGVICFPENFQGVDLGKTAQLRVTHAADYRRWHRLTADAYRQAKEKCSRQSRQVVGKIVGNYGQDIVYEDSFTPLTIERFTGKGEGAVYGSPVKIKDGCTPFENLFIAGTDQGFLGIIGSMLSGVSIVNRHLLA